MILIASIVAGLAVVLATWLYGNGSRWGPIVGLAGQVPWAALILLTGAHGLWLSWVPMTLVHLRNLFRPKTTPPERRVRREN